METYEVINLMDYLESYVEEKVRTVVNPHINHERLNKARTSLVDYLDNLRNAAYPEDEN